MGYWEHRKEVACDEEKQQNGAEDAERLDGICGGVPGGGAYDERCPHTRFAGQKNNLYNGKG